MRGSDVAALIASVAIAVLVTALLISLASLNRTLRAMREAIQDVHRKTIPMLDDMHATVKQANGELDRVDEILETAQSVSQTVDSASRLAYMAFSNPVVKAAAFGAGVTKAAKRFRKKSKK